MALRDRPRREVTLRPHLGEPCSTTSLLTGQACPTRPDGRGRGEQRGRPTRGAAPARGPGRGHARPPVGPPGRAPRLWRPCHKMGRCIASQISCSPRMLPHTRKAMRSQPCVGHTATSSRPPRAHQCRIPPVLPDLPHPEIILVMQRVPFYVGGTEMACWRDPGASSLTCRAPPLSGSPLWPCTAKSCF